jgi:hypothetical protein
MPVNALLLGAFVALLPALARQVQDRVSHRFGRGGPGEGAFAIGKGRVAHFVVVD